MPREAPTLGSEANPPRHVFVSVVRRGAATQIHDAPGADGRASVTVQLTFQEGVEGTAASGGAPPVTTTDRHASVAISLLGAGDVTGVDARAVSRVWPRPDVTDAEEIYFPLIEFSEVDLPWRYSPAPVTEARLSPWFALLILEEGEFVPHPVDSAHPLPTITVNPGTPLPRLEDAWAWAHVHLAPDKAPPSASAPEPTAEEVRGQLQGGPGHAVARLLAPRRLKEHTPYTAVLVPVYERGRLAGLGRPNDTVGALTLAWQSGAITSALELPVYYQWRFGTGADGAFETLAARLQVRPLPGEFGRRPIDVSLQELRPLGAPPASEQPAQLEGALRPWVPIRSEPWSEPWGRHGSEAFHRWFHALTSPNLNEAILAPPLYGAWYAAQHQLSDTLVDASSWFDALNADPRTRIAASAGTEVVQTLQQSLLASAWKQLAGIQRANETMRFTQLGRETSRPLYERELRSATDHDTFFRLTAPVLSNVLDGDRTVRARIAQSPIPLGVLQGAWRRLARPRGPMRQRQRSTRAPGTTSFLADLNAGRIAAARPPVRPEGLTTPTSMVATLGASDPALYDRSTALLRAMSTAGSGATFIEMLLTAATALTPADPPWLNAPWRRVRDGVMRGTPTRNPGALSDVLGAGPALPEFRIIPMPGSKQEDKRDDPSARRSGANVANELRRAFGDLGRKLSQSVPQEPARAPVDLDRLHRLVERSLDPETTFVEAIRARLRLAPGLTRHGDPLDPIMAAPEFPQPMVEPLRDRSQEWIVPGLDKVPQDTLVLLLTNRTFVEAYMVGLNHEMGRELLWHEYPTDQQGTYFRQFWRTSGHGEGTNITPITDWSSTALGQHMGSGDRLVLLVRSELLRRYPSARVFALRRPAGGPEEEHQPSFTGTLDPDVTYVGFEISRSAFETSGPGVWYFVIQQQPTEPLFGAEQHEDSSHRGYFTLSGDTSVADLGTLRAANVDERRRPGSDEAVDRSSKLARWVFRHPVRIEISADSMLQQMQRGTP